MYWCLAARSGLLNPIGDRLRLYSYGLRHKLSCGPQRDDLYGYGQIHKLGYGLHSDDLYRYGPYSYGPI